MPAAMTVPPKSGLSLTGRSPVVALDGSMESLAEAVLAVDLKDSILSTSAKVAPAPRPKKTLPLRARDVTPGCASDCVLTPNSQEPFEVENDIVSGLAILKVRTNDKNDHYAPYFAGKQRSFEIQIQGQLKNISEDERIFIGIETEGPIKLSGFFTKATAKIVLGIISATVQNAHCTMGNERECGQLTFPLDICADRLAVTHPGDAPPEMGVHMFPEEFSRQNRPALKSYNTEDTYSFSLHSMYVDLVQWQLCNLPGVGRVSLDNFLQKGQPLYFVGYAIPKAHHGPHMPKDKRYLFKFELENDTRQKRH